MSKFLGELVKGNFGQAVKSLMPTFGGSGVSVQIDPSKHTTPDGQSGWLFETAGAEYHYFKYNGHASAVDAYRRCPPVASILNRKAQYYTNGKVWVLNSAGKVATTPAATRMKRLLANPNPLQSRAQFEAQGLIFQELFGFNIILPIKPFGFTDPTETTSMWNIPASWIDVDATKELFNRNGGVALAEIVMKFGNSRVVLQIADLIIVRDFTPSFDTITFPGSKMCGLALPINNIIGAYESRNTLINYRGAMGILTTDPGAGQYQPIPLSTIQKEELQRDFRRYGLKSKQFQVIITTAQLKWQNMGYATKDLMLMEEVEESTKEVCRGFNFPTFILGLSDTTFSNMEAAEKNIYTNSIIPTAESNYEQLTKYFKLEENYSLVINKDFSHIPALQKDKKAAADARKSLNEALQIEWRNGLLTLNEWRVKNEEDPLSDERGKMYFPEYTALYGDPNKTITNGTTNQENQSGGQTSTQGQPSTEAAAA